MTDPQYERTEVPAERYVVEEPAVVAQPVGYVQERVVVPERALTTTTSSRFSPAGVLGTLAGLALIVFGAVAMLRAGTAGWLDDNPKVVSIAAANHTFLLGLIEVVAGALLVAAGLSASRGALLFVSVAIATASLIAAIQSDSLRERLAIEQAWAVILCIGATIVALAAALLPTIRRSSQRVAIR